MVRKVLDEIASSALGRLFITLATTKVSRVKECFIDNLLVRIHLIIETTLVDRP